jgi:hypothetical protein
MAAEVVVTRLGTTFTRRRVPTALDRGEHGTVACHHAGCGCIPCRAAWNAYQRARWAALAIVDGRQPQWKVWAGPAASHVRALRAQGVSVAEVARRAELAEATVRRALVPHTRIFSTTAERILAVRL